MTTREKILEAADELFGRDGFDATTTREIAERSGINKALIHYHFKTKQALLETLLDRYYVKLSETLQKELVSEADLRGRMLRMVDTYIDFLARNLNFSSIVQREASGGKQMDRIRAHMVPLFELGRSVVQAAYPSTQAGDLAAEQLLISFYGMVISYFTYSGVLEHLLGTDPMSRKNLGQRKGHLRRMVEIVLDEVERE